MKILRPLLIAALVAAASPAFAQKAADKSGPTITIGGEHGDAGLAGFTLVTSTYRRGGATGVIGVLGPTRMPYEKVISLVTHTSRLLTELLD